MAIHTSPQHVVVVGAGMVGLSTAWFLQREGVEVTVVDRHDVAAGASWGNAGWLAPALTLPLPEPAILSTGIRAALSPSSPVYVPLSANPRLLRFLADFARHCTHQHWQQAVSVFNRANAVALDAYTDLAAAPGDIAVSAPTRPATPFLAAFASESDREVLVEEFRRVNEAGGSTDYTLLDHDAVHALEPTLGDGVRCGVTMADQRYLNPGEFVHSLAHAVKAGGGQVITGRGVVDVKQVGAKAVVRFDDGSEFDADAVVVANGTWLGQLARPHGVRTIVQAGRGYSFTVHPDEAPKNPLYLPTQRVACTPLGGPDNALRVAGMMEFRKPGAPLDQRRIKAIVDAATPMFRGVDWEARTDEWVGSRPCTADGLPLVGRTRSARVYVVGGHGMWGVALGPLTGKLLAQQVAHDHTPDLLRHFNPLR